MRLPGSYTYEQAAQFLLRPLDDLEPEDQLRRISGLVGVGIEGAVAPDESTVRAAWELLRKLRGNSTGVPVPDRLALERTGGIVFEWDRCDVVELSLWPEGTATVQRTSIIGFGPRRHYLGRDHLTVPEALDLLRAMLTDPSPNPADAVASAG